MVASRAGSPRAGADMLLGSFYERKPSLSFGGSRRQAKEALCSKCRRSQHISTLSTYHDPCSSDICNTRSYDPLVDTRKRADVNNATCGGHLIVMI